MPIEDVFSIPGRGTVVTGRIERGKIKLTINSKSLALHPTRETVVTGLEMFNKTLDEACAGENVGILFRGIEKDDVERGMVLAAPKTSNTSYQVQRPSIHLDQGRRRSS